MLTKTDLTKLDKLISKRLKPIKSDIAKIRKDIDVIVSLFDREYMDIRRRIERIEDHLNLPPLSS
jgi:hypothetical protein